MKLRGGTMHKWMWYLALIAALSGYAAAQADLTETMSVTNSPSNIVINNPAACVLVRENSASPSAVFSITPALGGSAANLAAGAEYLFSNGAIGYAPLPKTLGTIQATTSGPFTFILLEGKCPMQRSSKGSAGSGSGTITGVTAGTGLSGGGSSGSVSLAVTNPFPSLPQGTIPSNNGSANTEPYPPMADTTQWGSSNAGANAQAAFSGLYAAGFTDFGSTDNCNESSPDIVVNPFAATHVPLKPEYVICKTTTLEVPLTVAPGVTPATSTEGMATLRGAGKGWSANQNQSGGTTLKAGSSFPKAGSVSGSQCTGCTVLPGQILEAYVDDGTNSALNSSNPCPAITWASSAPGSGAVCYVGNGSTTFLSSLPLGIYVSVPNGITATATNQVYSQIYSVTDNQHAIGFVQMACAPPGGITATSNYSTLPAMVPLGVGGNANNCNTGGLFTNHHVNQGINLAELSVHVNATVGAAGVVDYASPEGTDVNGRIFGFNLLGLGCETNSCQSSTFHNLMFTPDSGTNQTGLTTDFVCNGAAPQVLRDSVFANGSGTTDIGIIDNCQAWGLDNLHLEHKDPAIGVSHNITCTKDPCPQQIAATGTPNGQVISRIDMSSVGDPATNGILLDNENGEPYNFALLGISAPVPSGGITNVLNDVGKGNTFPAATANGVTAYFKDNSTYPFMIAPCGNVSNGICEYAGDMALYSSGAKLWDLGAAGRLNLAGNTIASNSSLLISGNPVPAGGTGATAFPQLYFNETVNTAPTTFNTGGTLQGWNMPSGFAGNVFDLHADGGPSLASLNSSAALAIAGGHSTQEVNDCDDTSGSGTAQSCTIAPTFPGTVGAGTCITYSTTTQNSGTGLTINVNGIGAKNVSWQGSTTLATGYVNANQEVWACYDGTNWELSKIDAGSVAASVPINNITSAGAAGSTSNGNNAIIWKWQLNANNKAAFTITENSASSTGTFPNQALDSITTLAGSTAVPLAVSNSLSGSQTMPAAYIDPTWNTTGVVAGALQINPTNTASGLGSSPFDVLLGGTAYFNLATQSATVATAATDGPNIALGGSQPEISGSGTTPYLNLNLLTNGALNKCTFALTPTTFTLALSPVSLCNFALPNAAVTWYWSCTVGWSNVAGTTPTFAEGVTWAHAPSAAFQMANILTTNTGTGTQLTTSTTSNSNILATGSLTNSATIFQATMSGTFTASATSGTFSPTLSLTGTGATGTAVGGCTIQ